jgi:sugar phosphate isomerase/epimerase
MDRRTFLAGAALLSAPAGWKQRLGIMCQLGPEEAAARQTLAAACAAGFENIQVNFPWDRVTAGYLRELPGWIRAESLRCQVLSAYVNCLAPATVLMSTRAEDFTRAIAYAAEVGARRLIAWTGSYNRNLMQADERNFRWESQDAIVRFLEPQCKLLAQAKLELALETYITLACPDALSLRRLLDRLPATVGAVLDPPNLTPLSRYRERDAALSEMFRALRGRISVVHLKDFRLRADDAGYDLPGPLQGEMNYALFARELAALPGAIPVIAEHLEPARFAEARRRLLAL